MEDLSCNICNRLIDPKKCNVCPECKEWVCEECASLYDGYCEECYNEFIDGYE